MADAYSTLLIERHADGYAVVTLNRPEALNALNSTLFGELAAFLDAVETDDSVRCLILTGSAKAFAAGADIKEMADQSYADMFKGNFFALGHDRITRFRKPIIAAVSGYALGGGCELAMLCDFIIASETAKFGQPEINLGLVPGFGGTQRLLRLAGRAATLELCLTGAPIDAARAQALGILTRVVPSAELAEATRALAAQLAAAAPLALRAILDCVHVGGECAMTEGLEYETAQFGLMFASEDMREGTRAFLERRKPDFSGR